MVYLYYKEQRQLKIFLTQIGPVFPLTSDPPVICFWKWIGWKDGEWPKNRNLESVSAKKRNFFSHPTRAYRPCVPTLGPPARHPPTSSQRWATPAHPQQSGLRLLAHATHNRDSHGWARQGMQQRMGRACRRPGPSSFARTAGAASPVAARLDGGQDESTERHRAPWPASLLSATFPLTVAFPLLHPLHRRQASWPAASSRTPHGHNGAAAA
jgi:hypothetical protein